MHKYEDGQIFKIDKQEKNCLNQVRKSQNCNDLQQLIDITEGSKDIVKKPLIIACTSDLITPEK